MAKKKRVLKTKSKVQRRKNGQIISGSSGLKNAGRPVGARSTGKKLKSANKLKSNVKSQHKKSAGVRVKPNKLAARKHTSSAKGVKRNAKGQLVKGTRGISKGRPAGNSAIDELNIAIGQVQSEKGKGDWLKDVIRRSYSDTTLAVAILNKKFPCLKAVEFSSAPISDEQKANTAKIREKIAKRFEVARTIDELEAEIEKIKVKQDSQHHSAGGGKKNEKK